MKLMHLNHVAPFVLHILWRPTRKKDSRSGEIPKMLVLPVVQQCLVVEGVLLLRVGIVVCYVVVLWWHDTVKLLLLQKLLVVCGDFI